MLPNSFHLEWSFANLATNARERERDGVRDSNDMRWEIPCARSLPSLLSFYSFKSLEFMNKEGTGLEAKITKRRQKWSQHHANVFKSTGEMSENVSTARKKERRNEERCWWRPRSFNWKMFWLCDSCLVRIFSVGNAAGSLLHISFSGAFSMFSSPSITILSTTNFVLFDN